MNIIKTGMKIKGGVASERAHRVGKAIIIKLLYYKDKEENTERNQEPGHHKKGSINDSDNYQGGFRKGQSTVDHILVIIKMVKKSLAISKGKLYVAFVDFCKVYDSVNRNILWDVLRRAGAGERC